MKKSLFLAGLLTFSSLIFAAKSYTVSISSNSKVGSVQLAKGEYTLHVDGDKAVFTDASRKSVTVPVKIQNGTGKKFDFTSVEASDKNGSETIVSIHLGGSTTTVEFGD